ncbi:MAG: carboxypeptidase regulatory-like domain-containing protein [Firmicutes bacterium]|nr:carboxypeptidase regulatory-like domain-containing protein [Bacillota bacterium]
MRRFTYSGKAVLLSALILVFYSLAGCSVVDMATEFGHINGIVKDSVTKQPISGVYVSTDYYNWNDDSDYDYTDSGGQYVLSLDSGTYDIHYRKDGYYDVTLTNITVISPFSQSRDIEMEPADPEPTPTPTPSNSIRIFASMAGDVDLFQAFYISKDNGTAVMDSSSPVGTGRSPAGISYFKSKARIIVANSGDNTVSVYSSYTGYRPITGSPFAFDESDGQPYLTAYDETSGRVFISRKGSSSPGKIEVLDLSNPSYPTLAGLLGVNGLADDPRTLRMDSQNRKLYIGSVNGSMITCYDTASNSITGKIPATSPVSFSLDVSGGRLFALKGNSNTISVIDISNPAAMQQIGETTVSTDSGVTVSDCEYASGKNILFTAQKSGSSWYLGVWNTTTSPPYSQAQSPLYLGSSEVTDIAYDPETGFLYAVGSSSEGYGLRIYDCRNYPSGQIYEVSGSPFFPESRYFMLGF